MTLTGFLESGGIRTRSYDMCRHILQLPRDRLLEFEETRIPYPTPLQRQARFAMVMRGEETPGDSDPQVWFIRFPLDEQGKLVQAARDDLLLQLAEGLGTERSPQDTQRGMQNALRESPYLFQPRQERLAAFHARLTVDLALPPSRHYGHARRYFQEEFGWDQWSFIGYQGIADLAARNAEPGNEEIIASAVPHLPPAPLEALCHCLENETTPESISRALLLRTSESLQAAVPDIQVITATLRGVSRCASADHRQRLLESVLSHPVSRHGEILAAIAGRLWEELSDAGLCALYLENLADNEQRQPFFDQILGELLYLPASRPYLLARMRDPGRSPRLGEAIGAFFNRLRMP